LTPANRISAIDFARGLGIILVVYGHALRGLETRGLVRGDWVKLSDEIVYAFHMPLFFFLSGLLIAKGLDRSQLGFVQDKIVIIAYPYILWSVIQTLLAAIATPGSTTDVGLPALLTMWKLPIAQFWFLFALFLSHLALALLWKQKWLIYLVAAIGLAAPTLPGLPLIYSTALSYFPFVVAGWFSSKWLTDPEPLLTSKSAAAIVAGATLVFALAFILEQVEQESAKRSLDLLLAISGILAVVSLAHILPPSLTMLGQIGQASMAIYVLHTIIIGAVRIVEIKLGMIEPLFMISSLTIIGVFGPLLLFMIASRFQTALWLGLGRNSKGN
jgi:fucose 4-O-acetylase-like acetyltransferase